MIETFLHFTTSGAFLVVIVLLAITGRFQPTIRKRYKLLLLVLAVQLFRDAAAYLKLPLPVWSAKLIDTAFILLLVSFFVFLLRDIIINWVNRRGVRVSKLVWDVAVVVIYTALILTVVKFVFGVDITLFLTTSAILTAVIGLAVQDTLSNLIAGVVFHFEDSLSLGDWVEIDGIVGEVRDLSWRAVRVLTTAGEMQVIPNSEFTKKKFCNLSRVGAARDIFIGTSYDDDPDLVIGILRRAALSTPGIRWNPEPQAIIWKFGDFSIEYRLRVWLYNYQGYHRTEGAVRRTAWYFFQEHGISIPFPIRTVYMAERPPAAAAPDKAKVLEGLRRIDMFRHFNDEELADIASYTRLCEYPPGTVIAVEGETGDTMVIVLKGKVEVRKGGRTLATLGPQDIFGEIALFTGEPRGATGVAASKIEVLVVRKEGFDRILKQNEGFIAKIEEMINERLQATQAAADAMEGQKSRQGILSQIRRYLLGG